MLLIPELAQLIHRREVQRLPHRAAAQRAVAYVGHDYAALAVDALKERRAGRYVGRAAHYRVVGIYAKRYVERVHRAAQAHVEAVLAREYLGHRAVEQEILRQLLDRALAAPGHHAQRRLARLLAHRGHKLVVVQLAYRAHALGEYLAVAAVRAEYEVVHVQVERLTDRAGLLAHRQVRRAGMVVRHAVVRALYLDRVYHALELAYEQHVVVYADELVAGVVAQLVLDGLLVLVDLYVGECDLTGGALGRRIYVL